jgi:hypothetical protein
VSIVGNRAEAVRYRDDPAPLLSGLGFQLCQATRLSWSRVRGQTLCVNRGVLLHERDQRRDWQHIFNHGPVMMALGIEAHVAVATNMLALPFMSVGGSLPFVGKA